MREGKARLKTVWGSGGGPNNNREGFLWEEAGEKDSITKTESGKGGNRINWKKKTSGKKRSKEEGRVQCKVQSRGEEKSLKKKKGKER